MMISDFWSQAFV